MANARVLAMGALLVACGGSPAEGDARDGANDLGAAGMMFPAGAPRRGVIDPRIAHSEARLAELAYAPALTLQQELRDLDVFYEYESLTTFSNASTGAFAYYARLDNCDVVAFRGTTSTRDVATDVAANMAPTPLGWVHDGFYSALRSIWEDDAPGLVQTGPRGNSTGGLGSFLFKAHPALEAVAVDLHDDPHAHPLVFVGHSLGAALATLAYATATYGACHQPGLAKPNEIATCALKAAETGAPAVRVEAVATFGSPRVGDDAFGALLGAPDLIGSRFAAIQRFVHEEDPVTQVPLVDLAGSGHRYSHPSTDEGTEDSGLVVVHDDGRMDGIAPLGVRIGDHAIAAYVESLRRAAAAAPH